MRLHRGERLECRKLLARNAVAVARVAHHPQGLALRECPGRLSRSRNLQPNGCYSNHNPHCDAPHSHRVAKRYCPRRVAPWCDRATLSSYPSHLRPQGNARPRADYRRYSLSPWSPLPYYRAPDAPHQGNRPHRRSVHTAATPRLHHHCRRRFLTELEW